MTSKKICIIIPCYNEEESIRQTLTRLLTVKPDVTAVVINDGSTDNTVNEIRSLKDPRIVLLELPFNAGIGTAVETGLLYARRHDADCAVKFDSDGQHLAEEIDLLLEPLFNDEADMVIGSRFLSDEAGFKSTFLRRVGISFFRVLSKVLTGKSMTDSTSGFRAYNKKALSFAAKYYPAFDYPEPEENILLLCNGFRLKEVQCKMNIRQGGKSSINPVKAVYYMIKVSLAMVMAALRPVKEKELK